MSCCDTLVEWFCSHQTAEERAPLLEESTKPDPTYGGLLSSSLTQPLEAVQPPKEPQSTISGIRSRRGSAPSRIGQWNYRSPEPTLLAASAKLRRFRHRSSVAAHGRAITDVAVNDELNLAATGSEEGDICLWRVHRQKEEPEPRLLLGKVLSPEDFSAVACLAWERKRHLLLASFASGYLRVFRVHKEEKSGVGEAKLGEDVDLQLHWEVRAHAGRLWSLSIGQMIDPAANRGDDHKAEKEVAAGQSSAGRSPSEARSSGSLARELLSHMVSPNLENVCTQDIVASAGEDGAVVVWDVETGVEVLRSDAAFSGRQGALCVTIHPSGRFFIAGGDGPCPGDLSSTDGIAISKPRPDGTWKELHLACQRTDIVQEGHAVVFALPSGRRLRFFEKKHIGSIRSVEVTSDGVHVVTGGQDGVIFIHNFATGRFIRELHGHTDDVTSLKIFAEFCITSSWDFTIRIWNWRTGNVIANLNTSTSGIRAVAASSDLGYIVSGGEETARETSSYIDLRDVSYDRKKPSRRGWSMHFNYATGSGGRLSSLDVEPGCIQASEGLIEESSAGAEEGKTSCEYVLRVWTA